MYKQLDHKASDRKRAHVNILAALLGIVRRQPRVIVIATHAVRAQAPSLLHHLCSS